MKLKWPWGGRDIELSSLQYRAGLEAASKPDATHYTVFKALRDAGVPARTADGAFPASQAATVLQEVKLRELFCEG